jgi:8-oxo-dGTP pyrophosphatase MutT (NUDIX family)
MKRGPFQVKGSKIVYKNPWIEVREDKVIRPSGEKGIFGTVQAPIGSTICALTKASHVYLVREYHYAQDSSAFELPSGGVDEKETPLKAAKRELKEETGLTARKWTYLGVINPFTVIFRAPNNLFLAEDLTEGEAEDEEKDLIRIEKLPFKKVLELVEKGEITHAASVAAILKTARLKRF